MRVNDETWGLGALAIGFVLALAVCVGWVMNVAKLFGLIGQDMGDVGVEAVVRGIGVFVVPLGAVAGYF